MFPRMEISHKIDVLIERNNSEQEYLSRDIPYLFLRSYNRVFYYLIEKYYRTKKKIHSIP